MPTIRIALTGARPSDYDVVIGPGAIFELTTHVARIAPAHRYAVIADANVARHWAPLVVDALAEADLHADLLTFEPGESRKTRDTWIALTDRMLEMNFGRDSAVLALGGGVTGDLAGFVAATFMRGVPVVQIPTSLLAMLDSAIGGKTGVDTDAGKNLIGAFHQPAGVIADPLTLTTLPAAELVGGLAEAFKHGAIADAAYLAWIESNLAAILAVDTAVISHLVQESVRIKAMFISEDEREGASRAALNFGHTVGHALEKASDYELHHGSAIAIGMAAEAAIGERMGVTAEGTAAELARMLAAAGLPTRIPETISAQSIVGAMATDKKARQGMVRSSLINGLGEIARNGSEWTFRIDLRLLQEAVADLPQP